MRKYILIVVFFALVCPVFGQDSAFETGQPQRICACKASFAMRTHSQQQPYRPFIVVPCEHERTTVAAVYQLPNWFDNFKRKRKLRKAQARKSDSIIRSF